MSLIWLYGPNQLIMRELFYFAIRFIYMIHITNFGYKKSTCAYWEWLFYHHIKAPNSAIWINVLWESFSPFGAMWNLLAGV